MGKQRALNCEEDAVDGQGHEGNEHQHEEDVGLDAATLRVIDDGAEAACCAAQLDQLGEHDVAEGQAEEQTQRVEDVGKGQGREDLKDNLATAGAEGIGGVDIAAADVLNGIGGVADHKGRAGHEDEHRFLELADSEQRESERNQGRHGDIAAHDGQGGKEGAGPAETAAENADGHSHDRSQAKAQRDAAKAGQGIAGQGAVEP